MMIRSRMLAALVVLALAGTVAAREFTASVVARFLANELDGALIECPVELEGDVACYRLDSDQEFHRTRLQWLLARFDDARWLDPWTEDRGVLARPVLLAGERFIVYLVADGELDSVAFVQALALE